MCDGPVPRGVYVAAVLVGTQDEPDPTLREKVLTWGRENLPGYSCHSAKMWVTAVLIAAADRGIATVCKG